MYTRDVKLSFPNNNIKKFTLSIVTLYVTVLTSFQENDPYWAIQRSWFGRVNALCNLLRKTDVMRGRSALPGRFLSRRCFTLCITVEVEPRIAKQYKCQYCCSCKNFRGKGKQGGKKASLHRFLADQNITTS